MGKGDKRTKRGKLFKGTYGNSRPRKKDKKVEIPKKEEAVVEEPKKEDVVVAEAKKEEKE